MIQKILSFLQFYVQKNNRKGHGVHSPFVYDFVVSVLNQKIQASPFYTIENLRNKLLNNKTEIVYNDIGAGSIKNKSKRKTIAELAKYSVKSKKWAELLYKICKHYNIKAVVELGTSLGITTCYLAKGSEKVYTFEGIDKILDIAKANFTTEKLNNIESYLGNFDDSLPEFLNKNLIVDLVYIDGNHTKEATLRYFNWFLQKASHNKTIFIFDDIYWSADMKKAWLQIKNHSKTKTTIDLYQIGLVWIDDSFKNKQHFKFWY